MYTHVVWWYCTPEKQITIKCAFSMMYNFTKHCLRPFSYVRNLNQLHSIRCLHCFIPCDQLHPHNESQICKQAIVTISIFGAFLLWLSLKMMNTVMTRYDTLWKHTKSHPVPYHSLATECIRIFLIWQCVRILSTMSLKFNSYDCGAYYLWLAFYCGSQVDAHISPRVLTTVWNSIVLTM